MFENYTRVIAKICAGGAWWTSQSYAWIIEPMAETDFEPSAAARLIDRRRVRRGVSVRSAAAAAGISEGRWRQIAKGYQQATAGVRVPVNTTASTLAGMARAVGLTPEDLEGVDRADVADVMRESGTDASSSMPAPSPVFGGSYSDPGYLAKVEGWLLVLQRRVDALEERGAAAQVRRVDTDSPRGRVVVVDESDEAAHDVEVHLAHDVENLFDKGDRVLAARDADDDAEAEAQQEDP